MTRLIAMLTILTASLAGASAQSMPGMPMPTPPPSGAPTTAPSTAPSPALVVHIKDFQYGPDPAKITVGETIEFINDDESAHTVTADDHAFDSGYMPKGATWSYTFTKVGTIPYYCIYHRFMRATIIVAAK
jgi:plastocyanin